MKSELVPLNGDPPIPITRDVTLLGRREYCDVVIPHTSLSKRHAILVRTDGLLIVRDLVSTNGTKVNGQRVMWAALLPNDRLTLGRYKFKVYLGPDDALSPSELGRRGKKPSAAAQVGALAAAGGVEAAVNIATPAGFPAPSGASLPIMADDGPQRGSTDPDADPAVLGDEDLEIIEDHAGLEFIVEGDEDEDPYIIELD
jgi:pSer/pThr/pTyr-binding forkhead associated (FHA) protein